MRFSPVFLLIAGATFLAACGDDHTSPSNAGPVAAFTNQCVPLECTFSNTSSDSDGTIEAYDWAFGDNSEHATTRDAVHRYATAGRFVVTLVVTDDDGATSTASFQVDVSTPNALPIPRFTASCIELTCQFTNESSDGNAGGSLSSYAWDFGDQSTFATTRDAAHTYAASGGYTVRLVVRDNQGAVATLNKVVEVRDPNDAPTAGFVYSCIDFTCSFTDRSSDVGGSVTSYSWDFGDGQTSTTMSPEHTFASSGSYTVGLTVTDDRGATGQFSVSVTVPAPGPAIFDFSVTCTGAVCSFTDETTPADGWAAWNWQFGDGEFSTERNPTHVYVVIEETTFTVTLSVWDWDLGGGVVSHDITVVVP